MIEILNNSVSLSSKRLLVTNYYTTGFFFVFFFVSFVFIYLFFFVLFFLTILLFTKLLSLLKSAGTVFSLSICILSTSVKLARSNFTD